MRELRMPQLALGDEDVTVLTWLKVAGDPIAIGEPLLEVETEKATMEVESPFDGILAAVACEPGSVVAAGAVIGYVTAPGEDFKPPESSVIVESTTPAEGIPDPSVESAQRPGRAVESHPVPRGIVEASAIVEHGELAGLPRLPDEASSHVPADPRAAGSFGEEILSTRRRAIARRMVPAAGIPQFSVAHELGVEKVATELERLRGQGVEATLSDALVWATAVAVKGTWFNAWLLEGDRLLVFDHANIAFAVDTPDGVVAPVIHAADSLSVSDLVDRRAELVQRALENRLSAEDIEGATFTVSNIGPLGADEIVPVVTPPQVAALGTGRTRDSSRGPVLRATITADHRCLDGADGARLLRSLTEALDTLGET